MEKKEVTKTPKAPKTVSMKKLPGLLKKSYTPEKFEKKILNKIYIPEDREFVKGYFKADKDKKGNVCIPRDTRIDRTNFKFLKGIGKEVKAQKFGIKLVPLFAVICFIAAVWITYALFRNVIARKIIVNSMESAFSAKTDIDYVNFDFWGAKLEVKGLQQANKDDVMKNIFEVGDIDFDFNLTELLRGKVDAQDIKVADLKIGTDRKTSGYLPKKNKKSEEQKKESGKQNALVQKAQAALTSMFAQYKPENIIAGIQSQLKSPAVAAKVKTELDGEVTKWKDKPAEMQKSVQDFSASAQTVINTDWSKIKDPVQLKNALDSVNTAVTQGQNLKKQAESSMNDFRTDAASVKKLSSEVAAALASDKALADTEIAKLKAIKTAGVKGIFNDTLNALMYSMLGKYYPYVSKAMSFALKMKSKVPAKKSGKKEVKTARRMAGKDIYYRKDTVPRLLIENAYGSGTAWSVSAKEVSSDPDLRGTPAVLAAKFTAAGTKNAIDAVIDGRSSTKNPLLTVGYNGSGFPVDVTVSDSYKMKSAAAIGCTITGDESGSFSGSGKVDLSGLHIETPAFEPAAVYDVYQKAMNSFTGIEAGFTVSYTKADGMNVSISTDAADRFADIFQNLLSSEIASISASAKDKVTALLSEKTGGVTDQIAQFTGIENSMNLQQTNLADTNRKLDDAKKQIMKQLAAQTGGAVSGEAAGTAAKALKGLFGK